VIAAAVGTLIAVAFALSTLDRWDTDRRRYQAAWTIALFLFAAGSLSLWWGAAAGWGEWSYRSFYLFGAVLNVPVLALGTVYLLAEQRVADRAALVVGALLAFAAGVVIAAPFVAAIPADALPKGSEVFGPGPRIAAAVASGLGATVLIAGALWSAGRLVARRRRGLTQVPRATRLVVANVLIAAGALVAGAAGLLNSTMGEMTAFAVANAAGITIIFAGFLVTNEPRPQAVSDDPQWLRDLLGDDEDEDDENGTPDNVTRIA
jgi:hypothetical protein